MKVITKDQAVSYEESKRAAGTPGVYVLVDPRDGVPRYVGSSQHVEYRLYAHMAETGRAKTPKQRWLAELKAARLWPELWVVEEFDVGPAQGAKRHEAERRWIEICQELLGGADMNTALTPLGHANSKDSNGKKLHAELVALRDRVNMLEAELASLRGFGDATRNKFATLHRVARCGATKAATQRNTTLWGVTCVARSGGV